ncbi:glutamate 5-kinase [Azospirillum lipoferum]|uniref:Glutamate 5-kinase n=1 Tax=Azospirillum lipoferum TaxID=193 RepID=A0A5A9GX30_AZOLI|nr:MULTISPECIES: glutamate 5-kinase [Azospirillum]KAA0598124.1 glutamate 5-kinase [Azospirillum lipoferum]MCP1613753.1 glutamate 5-kinase [Azospirillum lipoferum]MDW5534795.1 glutamate 5-kinase [Azospirillum sp. NL1]
MALDAPTLLESRRLVVKIGSALLVDGETRQIRRDWLDALADDVAACRKRGQEVVIVTSGAVACGREHLGLVGRALKLEEKQAAAATGQIRLAHAYQETLARHDVTVAQVLVTLEDTEERRRHLNARNTIDTLLKLGAVPVINENDTVATAEIRFGDNDRLAARVAQMVSADTLVLLSDIDGLYTADPRKDPDARHIPTVRELTPEIEGMAGEPPPGYSSGGMVTKIAAARVALSAGCRMVIAKGKRMNPLAALERRPEDGGALCTWFLPSAEPTSARKAWIAGHVNATGVLLVDDGAMRALSHGASLLPAGVTAVQGEFDRGDVVIVRTQEGREVARGLVAYSADDARKILRHKSTEIPEILGYQGRDEMIHRDDLVVR